MTTNRQPVTGPSRIYVDPTPTGIRLDVSDYLRTVLTGLAQAADEDPQQLLADLLELAALARAAHAEGSDSHAAHARDALVDSLLTEVGDGRIPVYGAQAGRLRDRIAELLVPRPVPAQRERGEAA
ncbi:MULTISPECIES: hypothetical protein [Streptomyces]|uniref:Uncharacterized protein n=1 Tax=Streptomyces evansiae TaxID=3075535 RepID=A0ABU2QZM2_9ACTN|nr:MULTISPECIES: hypothetical protein [unclassified Streptomyces]MDT0409899.1 hypothetical protein [Streptomyces sp. DSM 41979]MYQ60012.1 hypothetical protein [Streptomyces sp. SID4926]SCE40103.1 hypothetical protein GA0115252_14649 [Streptomyces sp. DfronAA-171]